MSLSPAAAPAEVVFDGTLGPTGSLNGAMEIAETFGARVGPNLFHSFETFNVNAGESATFTSTSQILTTNVIGRVTGGGVTTIDGLLGSSIPGADLWLVNPNGIMFGPDASLDVEAGFHTSTADYLVLEDGGRFAATDPGSSVLTMANPSAFGFIDAAVGGITLDGPALDLPADAAVSLVGGDLLIRNASIVMPGGNATLLSMAGAGEIGLDGKSTGIVAGDITIDSGKLDTQAASGGDILIVGGRLMLSNDAYVGANTTGMGTGDTGGDIMIRVDEATLQAGGQVATSTIAAGTGGSIDIDVAGVLSIQGTGPFTSAPAGLFANVRNTATGNGGSVDVSAREVRLLEGGLITAISNGAGDAGAITVRADERILIRNTGGGFFGALYANAVDFGDGLATGSPGTVTVRAPQIDLLDNARIQAASLIGSGGAVTIEGDRLSVLEGSQITASTYGPGDAGSVIIDVTDTVSVAGRDSDGTPSGIFSSVVFPASGAGGDIVIHTNVLELLDGGQLVGSAGFLGQGGDILVDASERVTISGGAAPLFTGLFNNAYSVGNAGTIEVDTPLLDMGPGSFLQSTSFVTPFGPALGNAGDVTVNVGSLNLNGGYIQSRTEAIGNGGNITINAADSVTLANPPGFVHGGGFDLERAGIFVNTSSNARGGAVTINTGNLTLLDGGFIDAATFLGGGPGGSIVINASGSIDISASTNRHTAITSSSDGAGTAGSIELHASDINVTGFGTIQAASVADGKGGTITVTTDRLTVSDGGSITALSAESGAAGDIDITAGDAITIVGTIDALGEVPDLGPLILGQGYGPSTINSDALGSGPGGNVTIAADRIFLLDRGEIGAATSGDCDGGAIRLTGRLIELDDGGIRATATGAGNAGDIRLVAEDSLLLTGGSIATSAEQSAGGNIDVQIGNKLLMVAAAISAEAGGITVSDDGGNVTIDPDFVILSQSEILASANAGNGGNIRIQAGAFIIDATSVIDASSQTGLDGEIAIDSPNEITGGVLPIETPSPDVAQVLAQRCAPQRQSERNTLTIAGRSGNGNVLGDFGLSPLGQVAADKDLLAAANDIVLLPAHESADFSVFAGRGDFAMAQRCFGWPQ